MEIQVAQIANGDRLARHFRDTAAIQSLCGSTHEMCVLVSMSHIGECYT
jgi:hypothetical protein